MRPAKAHGKVNQQENAQWLADGKARDHPQNLGREDIKMRSKDQDAGVEKGKKRKNQEVRPALKRMLQMVARVAQLVDAGLQAGQRALPDGPVRVAQFLLEKRR